MTYYIRITDKGDRLHIARTGDRVLCGAKAWWHRRDAPEAYIAKKHATDTCKRCRAIMEKLD